MVKQGVHMQKAKGHPSSDWREEEASAGQDNKWVARRTERGGAEVWCRKGVASGLGTAHQENQSRQGQLPPLHTLLLQKRQGPILCPPQEAVKVKLFHQSCS